MSNWHVHPGDGRKQTKHEGVLVPLCYMSPRQQDAADVAIEQQGTLLHRIYETWKEGAHQAKRVVDTLLETEGNTCSRTRNWALLSPPKPGQSRIPHTHTRIPQSHGFADPHPDITTTPEPGQSRIPQEHTRAFLEGLVAPIYPAFYDLHIAQVAEMM